MAPRIRKRAGKSKMGNPNWTKGVSANPGTQWQAGQSGNPSGFSEEYRTAKELARQHTAHAIARLREISEARSDAAGVRACEALLDRAEGKPTQGVELTGKDGKPVEMKATVKSDGQPIERTAAILEALARAGILALAGAAPAVGAGADAAADDVHPAHAPSDSSGVPPP